MKSIAENQSNTTLINFFSEWGKRIDDFNKDNLIETYSILNFSRSLIPEGYKEIIELLNIVKESTFPKESPELVTLKKLIAIKNSYSSYLDAFRESVEANEKYNLSNIFYEELCNARDITLNSLYDEIEEDFSNYYKFLHEDDEENFSAKFYHTESSFNIDVDFYGRGFFPPMAFHSEGHQDSMGICLFLALNNCLSRKYLNLVVLDDVIMSVDIDHRNNFCELLKKYFSDQQFIITTHDYVWANQLHQNGIVSNNNMLKFINWDLSTGPIYSGSQSTIEKIKELTENDEIPFASAVLRRELEFIFSTLAENLSVRVDYHSDNKYTLGDFLPVVNAKYLDLLKSACKAANSYNKKDDLELIKAKKSNIQTCYDKISLYVSSVNSSVHYTKWFQLGKKDFEPILRNFSEYLESLKCDECHNYLSYSIQGNEPKILYCDCTKISWNLIEKPNK